MLKRSLSQSNEQYLANKKGKCFYCGRDVDTPFEERVNITGTGTVRIECAHCGSWNDFKPSELH